MREQPKTGKVNKFGFSTARITQIKQYPVLCQDPVAGLLGQGFLFGTSS